MFIISRPVNRSHGASSLPIFASVEGGGSSISVLCVEMPAVWLWEFVSTAPTGALLDPSESVEELSSFCSSIGKRLYRDGPVRRFIMNVW